MTVRSRRSVTIVVLDGFGIGAMPDAAALRAEDASADTLGAVVAWSLRERARPLQIPYLAALGLVETRPELIRSLPAPAPSLRGSGARAGLGYPGADSFAGHQTLMGADMSHVVLCKLAERLDVVSDALRRRGHDVHTLDDRPLLVVDGVALVHDNLEADPGLNWNVSCRLEDLTFAAIVDIAQVVRDVAPVARVIAVGGHADGALSDAVRDGADGTVGLDTPASGFYRNGGLEVQHLGATVDHARQLPEAAVRAGVPVSLIGKAADLLVTDAAVDRRPAVDTAAIMAAVAQTTGTGLVVANVQQTDLAGHSRDARAFADQLELADTALARVAEALGPDDLLIVTGDHGNDPSVGHPFHTREWVPVLVGTGGELPPRRAFNVSSLADIGAAAARWLGLPEGSLAIGDPYALLDPDHERTT
ncbi:phosphopentomutase [Aeromicrobium phragmitis]|uniref:Phosphopentomutase n=1 Tax=Aeromicrobium phragmitis TaxID=2478914 RepID=A0A3L8PSQ6_9ACTN|nr:phosphopentomutase [Aeromicrobium phragmitis]RLV57022.1 phosphopentomutase [Aeromicrobium phragmitis]